MRKLLPVLIFLLLVSWTVASAADLKPSKSDKCPVCGMFVYKHPDWAAHLTMKDGKVFWFDGVKDMFKFIRSVGTYAPGKTGADIDKVTVTEYYGLKHIDGKKAYYVIGSDVLGPMGRELIPLASEADAKDFMRDHKGKQILRFDDVTLKMLKELDY